MSNYFSEALHNFTSDYAYGSQIKQLYNKGLGVTQIKEKLDYPVSIEKVSSYLWDYLLTSHQVVFSENDIVTNPSSPKYEMETDTYGRRSFRLSSESLTNYNTYKDIIFDGSISAIPNIEDCFFKMDGAAVSSYMKYMNSKQTDYLLGFPWPKREMYIHANERFIDIFSTLYSANIWKEVIICPVDGIRYILN